ncbi:MAG: DUF2726 domain-containing protein [Pseudomonadota bacterium]
MPQAITDLISLFVVGSLILLALKFLTEGAQGLFAPKYRAVPLLTKAEQSAWRALRSYIPPPYTLGLKVRLADIIKPVRNEDGKAGRSALNKVMAKHIDLVVYDPRDFSVVLAIEIDDKSHARRDRQERDAFVDKALETAGIPIERIPLGKGSFRVAQARLTDFFLARADGVGGTP